MERVHVLEEKAFFYDIPKSEPDMGDYYFDKIKGYWVNNSDNQPCINSTSFVAPRSKKADIETGEDRKGE